MAGSLLWRKTSRLILPGCASLRAASFIGSIYEDSSLANHFVRFSSLYTTSTTGTTGLGVPAMPYESRYMALSGFKKFYKSFEDFLLDGEENLANFDFTKKPYDISDVLKKLMRDMFNQIKLIHDNGFLINDINMKKFNIYIENSEFVLKIKGDDSDLKQNVQGSIENDLLDLAKLSRDVVFGVRQELLKNKVVFNSNLGFDLEHLAIRIAEKRSWDNITGHPFFYDLGCKIGLLIWAVDDLDASEYRAIESEMQGFRRTRQQNIAFWKKKQFKHVPTIFRYDQNSKGFIKCFRNVSCHAVHALFGVNKKSNENRDSNTVEKYFRARCPEFFCIFIYTLHDFRRMNHNKKSWPETLLKPF